MSRELTRSERRLAVLALIGLFWGALLLLVGVAFWLVAAAVGAPLAAAAAALHGGALAESAARARGLVGEIRIRAAKPGRRDALRLNRQAAALRQEGRAEDAVDLSERALAIFRRCGDRRGQALTLNGLGLAQARARDEPGALDSFEAAVALLAELGDDHGAGRVLANVGALHRGQGHDQKAKAAWHEALERLEPGTPSTIAPPVSSSGPSSPRGRGRRLGARREPTPDASSPAPAARGRRGG